MKRLVVGAAAAVGLALVGYLILERIPEVDPDPANGPVADVRSVGATQVPLSSDVTNPAGIVFLPDSRTYLISTDDRAFMELSADFSAVMSSLIIPNAPHAVGDTEGVTYLGDGRAAVIGENGVVVLMERAVDGWTESERFPIPGFESGAQLGSGTYDPTTRTLYTAQKEGEKRLYRIDLDDRTAAMVSMSISPTISERLDRDWREFTIAGLQFYDGYLYAVSEAFSSLLVFSPAGIVEEVIALTGINESSGITVRDGVLILIGDAEGYLPPPPIYVIDESATERQ